MFLSLYVDDCEDASEPFCGASSPSTTRTVTMMSASAESLSKVASIRIKSAIIESRESSFYSSVDVP